MWKDWIRPFVRPLPQWSTIALAPSSQVITATLHWDNQSANVTADHTVASLKPLVIASSVDGGQRPVLEYVDSKTQKRLGVLHLRRMAPIVIEETSVMLYSVAAGEHYCLNWLRRSWNAWLQNRSMLKTRAPHHLAMEPATVQQLMTAYLHPRPVVLVSVRAPGHQNIFPMDLIGPLERSGLFSLALRSTNVSESVMCDVREVALSSMPAAMKHTVYKLSEHHKTPLTDWNALPFSVRASRQLGVPVVSAALHIRELTIVHSQIIGSHTFFLCRIAAEENVADGVQLHHTAGFHQAYRRRRNMPFAEV
jgi:flavin reductase (DIM6/NTAB) family NADH-FMN oxidoreductase RutF